MTDRTDIEELIGKVSLGDRTALAGLYDATSGKLFSVSGPGPCGARGLSGRRDLPSAGGPV